MAREIKEDTEHKHMFKRGKVWWVTSMRDGERTISSTKETDLKKARLIRDDLLKPYDLRDEKKRVEAMISRVQTVDQHLAKIEDGKPSTTLEQGWQSYLDQSNRPDSGASTLRQYEFQYEAFAKWFKDNHPKVDKDGNPIHWELRQVTQEDVDLYTNHLIKKVSPTTFNRHVVLLSLVWRVLEKPARLPANPWKGIERKRFAVHSRRELTIEELGKVFNKAKGEMRLLLALGTFCGLRLGDAACLEWSSVDMVKGIISMIPAKTARRMQKRITLPIHRTLHVMLSEIPKSNRHGYVIPTLAERYHSYDGALAKDVLLLFQDAKIIPRRIKNKPKKTGRVKKAKDTPRKVADVGFHSLRHTFVSLCAAGGVSQSVVQSLVGHGSPAMTQHYTHIGIETAQKAVALLPDVTGANNVAEATDKTGANLETVLGLMEALSNEGLETAIKKAQAILGNRKSI